MSQQLYCRNYNLENNTQVLISSVKTEKLDADKIYTVVAKMYQEEMCPYISDVARRVNDQLQIGTPSNNDTYSIRNLTITDCFNICTCYPSVFILNDSKSNSVSCNNEIVIELVHPPAKLSNINCIRLHNNKMWVDPKEPQDIYPNELWYSFIQYTCNLLRIIEHNPRSQGNTLKTYQFKGGRYGFAVELYEKALPFLDGYSLGSICHIVQLAIWKGILRYENNILQPAAACWDVSSVCTSGFFNKSTIDSNSYMLKNFDSHELVLLKKQLNELLNANPNGVLLSQLKKRMIARFQHNLSPALFKVSKMSSLLQSDLYKKICRIYVDDKNHVVIQSAAFLMPTNVHDLSQIKGVPLYANTNNISSTLNKDILSPMVQEIPFTFLAWAVNLSNISSNSGLLETDYYREYNNGLNKRNNKFISNEYNMENSYNIGEIQDNKMGHQFISQKRRISYSSVSTTASIYSSGSRRFNSGIIDKVPYSNKNSCLVSSNCDSIPQITTYGQWFSQLIPHTLLHISVFKPLTPHQIQLFRLIQQSDSQNVSSKIHNSTDIAYENV
ncbi:uncharacterized protein CMU_005100 [Cryptosporidium muris RN66]|uniref:HTH OST-type domain-containing protein n=1 Tax=Cryptosporidium muris (strain RN66) TaxID=441375 RepID=B6AH92_CRYMR|nr:uncharacterized protein CMU_005100 [Cryptosporidium muris RN66]EEA07587.1 hypothetical protein CMU_005100 [Cryptosporidium muris RN66]|eukprot:XP_002141936.1 hypothetical protein [Cryptosporidium muris RN66]